MFVVDGLAVLPAVLDSHRPLDLVPLMLGERRWIPELEDEALILQRVFLADGDALVLQDGRLVWVEAAPPDAEQVEGMPFRNLNDNVTPVVIGGNDWAAAWAEGRFKGSVVPVKDQLGLTILDEAGLLALLERAVSGQPI